MYYEKRVCVIYCIIVAVSALLLARLYNLSNPRTNISLSVLDGQYSARIDVCSRSGFIYDTKGRLLSHIKSGKIALVNPAECTDALFVSDKLSDYASVSSASEIYEKIMDGAPFTLLLTKNADGLNLGGVYVYDRYDERNDIAIHFLGYNSAGKGTSGLRREYDELLNKTLHSTVSAVFDTNAKQKSMSPFDLDDKGYKSPDGIVTTIDRDLQMFCDGLGEKIRSGGVVVSDVNTGHILALSSYPDYDLQNMAMLLKSDKGEFINRTACSFTPGSVFKMIVAASALEYDGALMDFEYTCTGSIEVDGNVFRCHKAAGHGKISMKEAFANSCNTYFISLGRIIGIERIADTMRSLELDNVTRADFLSERENYFVDEKGVKEGYLANISFGQGDLCLSPLDMTRVSTAVSTGILCELSTIRGYVENGVFGQEKDIKRKRVFSDATAEKMRIMMKECVENGTGKQAKAQGVTSGGKTATAQTGRYDEKGVEYVHKWFCGVVPAESPEFSVCILFDFSTETEMAPAVVFKEICTYLSKNGL